PDPLQPGRAASGTAHPPARRRARFGGAGHAAIGGGAAGAVTAPARRAGAAAPVRCRDLAASPAQMGLERPTLPRDDPRHLAADADRRERRCREAALVRGGGTRPGLSSRRALNLPLAPNGA